MSSCNWFWMYSLIAPSYFPTVTLCNKNAGSHICTSGWHVGRISSDSFYFSSIPCIAPLPCTAVLLRAYGCDLGNIELLWFLPLSFPQPSKDFSYIRLEFPIYLLSLIFWVKCYTVLNHTLCDKDRSYETWFSLFDKSTDLICFDSYRQHNMILVSPLTVWKLFMSFIWLEPPVFGCRGCQTASIVEQEVLPFAKAFLPPPGTTGGFLAYSAAKDKPAVRDLLTAGAEGAGTFDAPFIIVLLAK